MFRVCMTAVLFILSILSFAQNKTSVISFPFFDDVENTSASQGNWTADTLIWQIKTTTGHSGTQVWAMLPSAGSYNYLTLSSTMNLSGAANPYISFWAKKSDGGTGAFSIEASNDGGATWTALLQSSFSGTQYTRVQASLSNYKQNNVVIRLGCYAPYGNTYYIDDFLIDNAPVPQSLVLLTPTNNGMKVKWGISTATDFSYYRVVMSTDPNAVNNFFNISGVSGHGETVAFNITTNAVIETTLTDLTFTNTNYYAKIYEQDTQDLINQGSDRVDAATTFNVTSKNAPFNEDFEGAYLWAADLPWAVTTDDQGDAGHSPTHAYEDSPAGNYPVNSDRRLVMKANFSSVARPVLKLNHRYSFETGGDFGRIELSNDNVNWTPIASFTGNSGGLWKAEEFDAGILKQQPAAFIRFTSLSNGSTQQDGWHLDDIEIVNNTRTTPFPFFDNADVDTSSTKAWIAGVYQLKIAADHTGGGQVWALPPTGNAYVYLTLAGTLNLSSAPNPFISFWAKKQDGGTGAFSLEVSNDGGGSWTPLLQSSFSGTQYTRIQASLANYKQNNVLIRIGCYAPYGNTYFVDDILIDNAPTPQSLALLNPTNNGLRVKWGQSTATDFSSYRIVLSTDPNAVNNYYSSSVVNGHGETRVFDIFTKATTETTLTNLVFTNTIYHAKIYEQDTQDLINQGSEKLDGTTTFNVTTITAPFTEDFEGSFLLAADLPWDVTTFDQGDAGHSGTHAYEDSPGGNYAPNSDRRLIMKANFSSVNRPVLKFNHRYSFENNADFGAVDISNDNVTWVRLAAFTNNSGGQWEPEEFDAGILSKQTNAFIRFSTLSNGANEQDGWHIDDIQIYDNSRYVRIPFVDSVEVESESKDIWIAGSFGIQTASAHSGEKVWALPLVGGSYNYLTLAGTLDLTNAPKPYISFWIKKADGGTGAYSIETSNNGGVSWTPISQSSFSGNNYTNLVFALNNLSQNNVLIRIGCYSPYGSTYFVDDIEIADSTGFVNGIREDGVVPIRYTLEQNYPNPFNPNTIISYSILADGPVNLSVYNELGEKVEELINEYQYSGKYNINFDASRLASGVYFYRISTSEFTQSKKMILLK